MNTPSKPPVARDFVGPYQDIKDLADELHLHLHALADSKAAPEGSQAMPFNETEFLKDVLKLITIAIPYVPGDGSQILAALLPAVSRLLGVAAPSTASNT